MASYYNPCRHTHHFIARPVAHIPDKGQVLQRYYGYYANRARRATQGSPGTGG